MIFDMGANPSTYANKTADRPLTEDRFLESIKMVEALRDEAPKEIGGPMFGFSFYESEHIPKGVEFKPPSPLEQQSGNVLFRLFCPAPKPRRVEFEQAFFFNTDALCVVSPRVFRDWHEYLTPPRELRLRCEVAL